RDDRHLASRLPARSGRARLAIAILRALALQRGLRPGALLPDPASPPPSAPDRRRGVVCRERRASRADLSRPRGAGAPPGRSRRGWLRARCGDGKGARIVLPPPPPRGSCARSRGAAALVRPPALRAPDPQPGAPRLDLAAVVVAGAAGVPGNARVDPRGHPGHHRPALADPPRPAAVGSEPARDVGPRGGGLLRTLPPARGDGPGSPPPPASPLPFLLARRRVGASGLRRRGGRSRDRAPVRKHDPRPSGAASAG